MCHVDHEKYLKSREYYANEMDFLMETSLTMFIRAIFIIYYNLCYVNITYLY